METGEISSRGVNCEVHGRRKVYGRGHVTYISLPLSLSLTYEGSPRLYDVGCGTIEECEVSKQQRLELLIEVLT